MLYYSGWSGVQVNLSCPLAMSFIQKKTLKRKKLPGDASLQKVTGCAPQMDGFLTTSFLEMGMYSVNIEGNFLHISKSWCQM